MRSPVRDPALPPFLEGCQCVGYIQASCCCELLGQPAFHLKRDWRFAIVSYDFKSVSYVGTGTLSCDLRAFIFDIPYLPWILLRERHGQAWGRELCCSDKGHWSWRWWMEQSYQWIQLLTAIWAWSTTTCYDDEEAGGSGQWNKLTRTRPAIAPSGADRRRWMMHWSWRLHVMKY